MKNNTLMETKSQHICPWWLGYFLINPLRRFRHNSDYILMPYISPGMRILDYGCAMGYFSLPLARLTGENGKVFCFDIQQRMLTKLFQRAQKADLDHIIEVRLVDQNGVAQDLEGTIDFVMLFAVVHEVPDQEALFGMLAKVVKPAGRILFAEPKGHVREEDFHKSISLAEQSGFTIEKVKKIRGSHGIILRKKAM